MEHIAALLLIVGCADDMSACKELPAPVPLFETAEECDRELRVVISKFTGEHQQILAKCVDVDPAMEEEDAELVWDVRKDGTLYAAVEIPDVMVASTEEQRSQE
jgi:disulfide oxidoreductase YuzD